MYFLLWAIMTTTFFLMIKTIIMDSYSLKSYGTRRSNTKHLSWPAKKVLRKFNQLPKDNRPYGNIVDIVKALDVKYGGARKITNHFEDKFTESIGWNNCRCYSRKNCHVEYRDLYDNIEEIQKAVDKQKHELQIAGIEESLNDAKAMIRRLREEKELIEEVTKELT